jgi:hypothetical protein
LWLQEKNQHVLFYLYFGLPLRFDCRDEIDCTLLDFRAFYRYPRSIDRNTGTTAVLSVIDDMCKKNAKGLLRKTGCHYSREDRMEEGHVYKNVLGRRVIIAIPIIFMVMAAIFLLMVVPSRYEFKVTKGHLGLWITSGGWLNDQQSKVFGSVPVGNADFGNLLGRSFETETEALKALSSLTTTGTRDRQEKLIPLEKQIAGLYTDLVAYHRVAKELDLPGKDDNVKGLQDWLNYYMAKLASEPKKAAGSETFPYELLDRSSEGTTGKTLEGKKK